MQVLRLTKLLILKNSKLRIACELLESVSNHAHEDKCKCVSFAMPRKIKVYIMYIMRQLVFNKNNDLAWRGKIINEKTTPPCFFVAKRSTPLPPQSRVAPSISYNTVLEPSHSLCVT